MSWHEHIREHPTMGVWYERYRSRPSWVVRGALVAAVLVVVVPLVLLTLAAVIVGMLVFAALSLVASIGNLFGGGRDVKPSGDDGRRNVRVIQR